jgi:membrane protease YdiL (CAAX protease family)
LDKLRSQIARDNINSASRRRIIFRSIIFGLARKVWAGSSAPSIALSTAAFSLDHISLNTAPDGLAVAQLLFTLPMGVVFAFVRERTGSIWPGFFVHVATKLPSAF